MGYFLGYFLGCFFGPALVPSDSPSNSMHFALLDASVARFWWFLHHLLDFAIFWSQNTVWCPHSTPVWCPHSTLCGIHTTHCVVSTQHTVRCPHSTLCGVHTAHCVVSTQHTVWCPHCVVSTRWRFCVNLCVFLCVFVDVCDFYKKMCMAISSQVVWFSGRDLHSRPVSWKKGCRFFQVVLIPSIYFRVCLFQEPRSSLQGYLSQVLLN